MMKKSNKYSSKLIARRDLLNGISAITIMLIVVFAFAMFLTTFGEFRYVKYDMFEGKLCDLERMLRESFSQCFIFASSAYETIVLAVIPFALGLSAFAFLGSKSHCYNVLTLPLSRKKLFNNRFFLPLVIVIAIALIYKIAVLKYNLQYRGYSQDLMMYYFYNLLACLQQIIVSYIIGVAGCVFCTRVTESAIFGVAFVTVPCFTALLIGQILGVSLRGNAANLPNSFSHFMLSVNSLNYSTGTSCDAEYGFDESFSKPMVSVVAWIIISIGAIFIIRWYFENHYKAENSGFKSGNKASFAFLCYSASVAVAYVLSVELFDYTYDSYTGFGLVKFIAEIALIGFLIAVVVGFVLSFKINKISIFAGVAVVSIVLISAIVGATGLFGFYNRLPKAEEIKTMRMQVPFRGFVFEEQGSEAFYNDRYGDLGQFVEFTTPEDIEKCLEIHKTVLENKTINTVCSTGFEYTLNNGKVIERSYNDICREAVDLSFDLWETAAIKSEYEKILFPERYNKPIKYESSVISIVSKQCVETSVKENMNYAQFKELREAILSDIKALSADEWFSGESDFLGTINMIFTVQNNDENYVIENYEYPRIPVRANMVNTIEVLKKLDVYKYLFEEGKIKKISICDFNDLAYKQSVFKTVDYKKVFIGSEIYYEDERFKLNSEEITDKNVGRKLLDSAQRQCIVKGDEKILVVTYYETAPNGLDYEMAQVYIIKEAD